MATYFTALMAFAQTSHDTTTYKPSKLKLDEVNFVSGYYSQNGNNSAVTGGIGTEKLTNFSSVIDLKISKQNRFRNTHTLSLEVGVDAYSSASSDMIDGYRGGVLSAASSVNDDDDEKEDVIKNNGLSLLKSGTISKASTATSGTVQQSGASTSVYSRASYSDVHVYPSLTYGFMNEDKHYHLGTTLSYSHEFDYESRGAALSFTKFSKDNNREFGVKVSGFFDEWKVIIPKELRDNTDYTSLISYSKKNVVGYKGIVPYGSGSEHDPNPVAHSPRESYMASFSLSQVVNMRLQVAMMLDLAYQQGLLATSYQRVWFTDNSLSYEMLPDNRFKVPVGVRANYFAGDRVIFKAYYRYYWDDWNVRANTFELEMPVKITPFFSVAPFGRYYQQSAAKYFAPYKQHTVGEEFFTSDYDLSKFNSQAFGLNVRLSSADGVLGIRCFNAIEMRYGHYNRSNGLNSNTISIALKFK